MNQDFDCRHFRGDKPCTRCGPARTDCRRNGIGYLPLGPRTLVIKLGALGDVLRTTTLLPAIGRDQPGGTVSWVTAPGAVSLLDGLGLHRVMPWGVDAALWAEGITWDHVICLDKEEGPTALATRVSASRRSGFGRNRHGLLVPLSEASRPLFDLGLDDDEKFRRNTVSYPELIARACGLTWGPNRYHFAIDPAEMRWADDLVRPWGDRQLVGLNIGSGDAFAGKRWPLNRYRELARHLLAIGVVPVWLGGEREGPELATLKGSGDPLGEFPGWSFTLRQFAALISRMSVLVAGDTLAMHLAIATGTHTVALFGSTTEREITFYGNGQALVGKAPCAPCYRRTCPVGEICQDSIPFAAVREAVENGLRQVPRRRR